MDRKRLSFNTGNISGTAAQKLAAISEAGFSATTFWPSDFFGLFEFVDGNFAAAEQSGLRPTCYMMMRSFEGLPQSQTPRKLEIARQMMDQMQLFGAKTLVQTSNIGTEVDQDWSRAVEEFQALGELARSRDVRVAFEPLSQGPWINTWSKGWDLIRDVDHPNIGLVIDASHIFLQSRRLRGWTEFRATAFSFARFPTSGHNARLSRNASQLPAVPGEGVKPVRALAERVLATGYQGDFSAEVFNAFYRSQDPAVVARRGFEALERLFEKELAG